MPRGSRPGERRGGRQKGTPNKKTMLRNAALGAAAADPNVSPLDFLLALMRDQNLPLETRITVAHEALPYVHSKPQETIPRQPTPGRYGNAYGGLNTGWGARRSIEVRILRGVSEIPQGKEADLTPLGFLLGVMKHEETPPRLRLRVASMVAPYLHPKRVGAGSMKVMVQDSTGFKVDPAVAMELRDAKHRLHILYITRISQPENYNREAPGLETRVAAIEKTLECPYPALYGLEQLNADRERLKQLSRARGSGLKMTREEDVEEAHLTARVASWSTIPEHDARTRLFHLKRRQDGFASGHEAKLLSLEEQAQLRLLRTAYPELPPDASHPLARVHNALKEAQLIR
jgi:hypothetical protein